MLFWNVADITKTNANIKLKKNYPFDFLCLKVLLNCDLFHKDFNNRDSFSPKVNLGPLWVI